MNEIFIIPSSGPLSLTEHYVLENGHNFKMTTICPPLPKIIAATEEGMRRLDGGIRENIYLKAIGILSKIEKHDKHNLSKKKKKECDPHAAK